MTHRRTVPALTVPARTLVAAAALLAVPLLALAQGAPSADETRKRAEMEQARKRLETEERRSKDLQADVDKNAAERERINARLIETGKLIQQSEAQLTIIESKLAELEAEEKQRRAALEQRHGAISALLAALQRIGRNPPPVMITRREDALTMVRSAMLLSSAFPEMRQEALGLAKELKDLARVIKSGSAERDRRKTEIARHDAERVRLAGLQDEKRRLGAEKQAEWQNVRQEVARLAKSVEEVSDFLQRLDKGLGDRMPAPEPKAGAPVATLAPAGERVAMLAPSRIKPNIPFEQSKGMLQLPSQGRRILSFGQKTTYGTQSKGIGIQTRPGGTVFAPCDGLIVYAGEFRTYGQLLIISPGSGYHILLAGLSQIDVQVGQSVLMGEPVGVMSAAVKSQAAQDSGPVLTVEFRKEQRPIDPDPWWSDASRKVQG